MRTQSRAKTPTARLQLDERPAPDGGYPLRLQKAQDAELCQPVLVEPLPRLSLLSERVDLRGADNKDQCSQRPGVRTKPLCSVAIRAFGFGFVFGRPFLLHGDNVIGDTVQSAPTRRIAM